MVGLWLKDVYAGASDELDEDDSTVDVVESEDTLLLAELDELELLLEVLETVVEVGYSIFVSQCPVFVHLPPPIRVKIDLPWST